MATTAKIETPTAPDPTTIRLGADQHAAIERICKVCNITKNALINLAVSALADSIDRTGKLPVPQLRKGKRGGSHEPAK